MGPERKWTAAPVGAAAGCLEERVGCVGGWGGGARKGDLEPAISIAALRLGCSGMASVMGMTAEERKAMLVKHVQLWTDNELESLRINEVDVVDQSGKTRWGS